MSEIQIAVPCVNPLWLLATLESGSVNTMIVNSLHNDWLSPISCKLPQKLAFPKQVWRPAGTTIRLRSGKARLGNRTPVRTVCSSSV
jgi:hypothetical protein